MWWPGWPASGKKHRGSRIPHSHESEDGTMSEEKPLTRRWLLLAIGAAFNGIVGVALAVPVVGYLLSPIKKKSAYSQWISLGSLSQFPEGQTRLADFVNPFEKPQ